MQIPVSSPNPIKPNEQAILALHRVSTGSSGRDTNTLTHIYRLHCAIGNFAMEQEAERETCRSRLLAAQSRACSTPLKTWRGI
jgi:hypothetical protein